MAAKVAATIAAEQLAQAQAEAITRAAAAAEEAADRTRRLSLQKSMVARDAASKAAALTAHKNEAAERVQGSLKTRAARRSFEELRSASKLIQQHARAHASGRQLQREMMRASAVRLATTASCWCYLWRRICICTLALGWMRRLLGRLWRRDGRRLTRWRYGAATRCSGRSSDSLLLLHHHLLLLPPPPVSSSAWAPPRSASGDQGTSNLPGGRRMARPRLSGRACKGHHACPSTPPQASHRAGRAQRPRRLRCPSSGIPTRSPSLYHPRHGPRRSPASSAPPSRRRRRRRYRRRRRRRPPSATAAAGARLPDSPGCPRRRLRRWPPRRVFRCCRASSRKWAVQAVVAPVAAQVTQGRNGRVAGFVALESARCSAS